MRGFYTNSNFYLVLFKNMRDMSVVSMPQMRNHKFLTWAYKDMLQKMRLDLLIDMRANTLKVLLRYKLHFFRIF